MNPGYEPAEISKLSQQLSGKSFLTIETDDDNDEFRHFYFLGKHEGRAVIYDAVVYTLRLQHESEMLEIAEEKAMERFPEYRRIRESGGENDDAISPELESEIGLFLAETIMELEEQGDVKVTEHAEIDTEASYGIGLDVGLNVARLTDGILEKLITDFNSDTLALDETLVTFERKDEDDSQMRFRP